MCQINVASSPADQQRAASDYSKTNVKQKCFPVTWHLFNHVKYARIMCCYVFIYHVQNEEVYSLSLSGN